MTRITWLPFLLGALLLALLFVALSPPEPRAAPPAYPHGESENRFEATLALGVSFWVFVTLLIALIAVGTAVSH